MGCKKKTNDESGTPRSQSGWKTSWDKKDDKEDQCASRVVDSSNTNQCGKKEAGSSPPSSGKWAAKRKLLMRVGPLVQSLDGKLLGTRRMTKKINVDPKWLTLQTLTNVAKRKLDHLLLHLSGWKTSWDKKDDKEDQCASRVVDSSNTNQCGKKEVESSPPSSGKWAAKRKLLMRVGPLVLSLDGKLLGTRRMTKKINVDPKWLTLQTLTNVAKRKLDHLLLHLSGWKTSWDKKDDKEDQCASRVVDSSNTNQCGKKEAGSSPPSFGKWAAKRKLMMRVGPLVLSLDGKLLGKRRMTKKINVHPKWLTLQTLTNVAKRKLDHLLLHLSGWKTSWDKKDDKEDQCASRVEDSSNTNQWGKKEAGSSPPSSGKWAAKRKLMMRVGPLVLSLDGKLLGPRRMTKKINVHPEWKTLQTLTNELAW
ncbi:hypothetical protein Tco_0611312 [Tanacetum coccineum]